MPQLKLPPVPKPPELKLPPLPKLPQPKLPPLPKLPPVSVPVPRLPQLKLPTQPSRSLSPPRRPVTRPARPQAHGSSGKLPIPVGGHSQYSRHETAHGVGAGARDTRHSHVAHRKASPTIVVPPKRRSGVQPKRHRTGAGGSGALAAIGRDLPFPLPLPDWSKPIILALILIAVGFGIRARRTSRRVTRLERQRRELTADLDSMQSALVPPVPAQVGHLGVSVAYRPADGPAAGGDFYEIFRLPEDRVAIILGDVSGHGREALAHAAQMHYALRAYVEAGLEPRGVLNLAGRVLSTDHSHLFTTVVIAIYDGKTASLTYATAGHPPPITLGHPAHEPVICCSSPPLGWGFPTGLRQTTIPFSQGSRACFFTDGLPETPTADGLLGHSGVEELLRDSGSHLVAADLLDRVRARALLSRDDMAACVIDASAGTAPDETVVEEFEIGRDELAAGQVARFLLGCGIADDDAASAIEETRRLTTDGGRALLTVYRGPLSAAATVAAASAALTAPLAGSGAAQAPMSVCA